MAYDGKIMRRALQRYEEDKQAREARLLEWRESIFQRQPRLRQIEAELRSTTSRLIASALRRGTDPRPAVARLRKENLSLQAEKRTLLAQMGLSENSLEETAACPLCGDTGYQNGRVCRCLRSYYTIEQQQELSRMLDLGGQSFDSFSLDWYSDSYHAMLGTSARKNMKWVYDACKQFAESFGPESGNLFFSGNPGLGKTFLSAAIAREVSGGGWSVFYDTAGHIFQQFEAVKFGREDDSFSDVDRVMNCDLFILDDLGTEMTTAFVQSALYQIINGRILEKKSTILNTNLKLDELSRRYTPQITSRIEGEYQILPFFGEDIRKLKKARRNSR